MPTTDTPPTSAATRVWVLVCADGFVHVESGGMPTAETERCALDAAMFMDDPRESLSRACGPHTVREGQV